MLIFNYGDEVQEERGDVVSLLILREIKTERFTYTVTSDLKNPDFGRPLKSMSSDVVIVLNISTLNMY